MGAMRHHRIFEGIRRTSVGLLTALFLLSTLATFSLTVAPDCCTGKMCPIHHKYRMPPDARENSYVNCEHDSGTLLSCSMSCSHSEEEQIQTTVFFLLPRDSASIVLLPLENAMLASPAFNLDRFTRPPTPPPRLQASPL